MLPALYDDQRSFLARLAGMLVLGAGLVLPLTAQGSFVAAAQETAPTREVSASTLPGPLTYPTFTITRDPFETDHVMLAALVPGRTSTPGGQSNSIGVVLPPNLGAEADGSAASVTPSQGIAVRAVVTGERSRALVDVGGKVEVLAVGDALGDLTITAIDSSGVVLSDGSRIPLEVAR